MSVSESPPGRAHVIVQIVNERGLHARASAKFVKLAGAYDAEVKVTRDEHTVDALSIMGLMMLAAGQGATIAITAHGRQADEAVAALARLIAERFEEDR